MKKILFPFVMSTFLLPSLVNADGLLSYKPPPLGTLHGTVGGGTRSLGIPKIQVLAPKQTALSQTAQPFLYWFLPTITQQPIQFTLFQKDVDEPILEKQLVVTKTGVQRVSLADYAVTLEAGKEYVWTVAFDNSAASGAVLFQAPAEALSTPEQQAQAGYWYDVLAQLIESHSPLANDLLKQIGLHLPPL